MLSFPAIFVGGAALTAVAFGKKWYDLRQEAVSHWDGSFDRTAGGGGWDAFRHAYVSARLAQMYGLDNAYALGAWYEGMTHLTDPSPDSRDINMDLWNDKIGASIGNLYNDATQALIASEIKDALQNGFLITDYQNDPKAISGGAVSELTGAYYDLAGIAQLLKDPLVLDLNHDGAITTISADAGITFDHGATGVEYGTGWLNAGDAWLALDVNGNGVIDSGRELFGDNTIKLDGNRAKDAFDALASFDANGDGKVDIADATGDTDLDGVMEAGETYWDMNHNGVYDASTDKTFADLRLWKDASSARCSSSRTGSRQCAAATASSCWTKAG